MKSILKSGSVFSILAVILATGCVMMRFGVEEPQPLTDVEKAYKIVREKEGEVVPANCLKVKRYDVYTTPCGSSYKPANEEIQLSCIRREVTANQGHLASIQASSDAGWYTGLIYKCTEVAAETLTPPSPTITPLTPPTQ